MQVSVEASGSIRRKLNVQIPGAEIDQEISERLKVVAKRAKLPGFRPGKAPPKVILQRYAPQVINEVVTERINSSYRAALKQAEITPAGLVSIEPTPYEAGKDFQYVATIELYPKLSTPTLRGQTIKRPKVEITAADIERTLQTIQQGQADYVAYEGPSSPEDRLVIDFDGTVAGKKIAALSAKKIEFGPKHDSLPVEFGRALTAVRAGDTKEIETQLPEHVADQTLAGAHAVFTVVVQAVQRPVLPKLDDQFAARLGVTDGGLAKMKQEIETNLQRELAPRLYTVMRTRVFEALQAMVEKQETEIPQVLIEQEVEQWVKMMTAQLPAEAAKINRADYAKTARRRVINGLIGREIVNEIGLQVTPDEIRARLEQMADSYQEAKTYVESQLANKERVAHLEATLMEEKMVECMLETATVVDEKMSFQTFMDTKKS